jgi:hypothetical protein
MVALVAAIQAGREWAVFSSGLFGLNPGAEALLQPLTLAWFIGIAALSAAVVHQDAIPGVDQDWLIRPLHRHELLLAKLAFLALTISVPMFVLDFAHAAAMGMPIASSIEASLWKELFVFACFIVPVVALASTTRNMTELVIVGGALVLAFASSLGLSAFLFGTNWCPTCHTGMAWLQHLLQHVEILAGAVVILVLQYYRRLSAAARGLAVVGAVCLVFLQLPWSTAFAIERWLSRPGGETAAVGLEVGHDQSSPAEGTAPGVGAMNARNATQLLLHGHLDQAFEYLRRRARPGNAVTLDLPLRSIGISADELVLLDRSQVRVFGEDGRLLYRGTNPGASPGWFGPEAAATSASPDLTYLTVDIPRQAYHDAAGASVRLQIDYFLTLVKVRAEYRIAALDGQLRSADAGYCATMLDRDAVTLACKRIAQAPFCYSVALYGPDGRHNPEIVKCDPDYRRHWPALVDVLAFYGADLPLQAGDPARYPIDAAALGNSYVLVKIYGEVDHFERALALAPFQPGR